MPLIPVVTFVVTRILSALAISYHPGGYFCFVGHLVYLCVGICLLRVIVLVFGASFLQWNASPGKKTFLSFRDVAVIPNRSAGCMPF